MPPDPKEEPEEEANAAACPSTIGSEGACCRRTECKIFKNFGFSVSELGVGGRVVVVPMERD